MAQTYSVTVTAPVIHDGEKKQPGDPIDNLSEKAAARLIRLGVARLPVNESPESTAPPSDGGGADDLAAEIARIKATRTKKPLIAELAKLGLVATDEEKVADLQGRLIAALTGQDDGASDGDAKRLTAEEEADLAAMDRATLIDALNDDQVDFDVKASDDQLRALLKKQWYG